MNNKGFTLVELLAVIAILSILSGSAVTAVTSIITKQRKKAYKNFEGQLRSAAVNYVSDRTDLVVPNSTTANYPTGRQDGFRVPNDAGWTILDAEELHDMGLIDNLVDPSDKTECDYKNSYVKVKSTYANGDANNPSYNLAYTYMVCLKCSNYTSSDCGK